MNENFKCQKCEASFASQQALNDHGNAKHFETLKQSLADKLKKPIAYLIVLIIVVGGVWLAYGSIANPPHIGAVGSTHIHQDFKVYLQGKAIDFSQTKYQVRSSYVHVEDNDGDVIHVHATGVRLGMFFDSVGMQLTKECFKADDGVSYCNGGGKMLKFYVNNMSNSDFGNYELRDLDKILVSYGDEDNATIQRQLASITDKAKDALNQME